MSRDYPDWINPFKAAQARREFAGTIRLSDLRPVVDLIDEPGNAELSFSLAFCVDDQREVCIRVRVSGDVPMICQRTLQPFQQRIDSESVVAVVDSAEAADRLPEDYEPLVLSEPRLRIADIVTEELLLALPLVPKAPDSEPVGSGEEAAAGNSDTHQPFAGLAALARKRD